MAVRMRSNLENQRSRARCLVGCQAVTDLYDLESNVKRDDDSI